jgi:AraC family transcriptional regulator, arabinose operon regulatory protein
MVETPAKFLKCFSKEEREMDRRIRRVRTVLDEQYRDPPSIHELAAMIGLSSSRLAHLFREEVGMSIRSYIVERRLQMASMLIVQTHERISQIAYGVGFNDISNFNHSFKKRFHMAPGDFRNTHGNGEPGGQPKS